MKLYELQPAEGSVKDVKRIGRGHGSGNGKTAGKGHKGQKARSGGGIRPGGAVVDAAALVESGAIKNAKDGIKILGNGELTKSLTVKADKFTAGAQEKIEKAGGKAEVI